MTNYLLRHLTRGILVLSVAFSASIVPGENWGQADSDDKIDPSPWMWSLRGERCGSPEEMAAQMASRKGAWAGIFSDFVYEDGEGKWIPLDGVESNILYRSQNFAILHAAFDEYRDGVCSAWALLAANKEEGNWVLCDLLVRRDIGYSHVRTEVFSQVKGVPGPVLLVETYRGGRRLGDQPYELYCLADRIHAADPNQGQFGNATRFLRGLVVKTRYSQNNSWRGEAIFSLDEESGLKVEALRENMAMDKIVRATFPLSWDPETGQFDSSDLEDYIGLPRLEKEDRSIQEQGE